MASYVKFETESRSLIRCRTVDKCETEFLKNWSTGQTICLYHGNAIVNKYRMFRPDLNLSQLPTMLRCF